MLVPRLIAVSTQTHSLPVMAILKTMPVYALIVASFSSSWNIYFVSFSQPEYMSGVLNMGIESVSNCFVYSLANDFSSSSYFQNGLLSSLPHLAYTISSCVFALICDKLRESGRFSVTGLRKFFNSVGK